MKKRTKFLVGLILILAVVMLLGSIHYLYNTKLNDSNSTKKVVSGEKIDDWEYDPENIADYDGTKGGYNWNFNQFDSTGIATMESTTISGSQNSDLGFTVGGAQNIENYRENIENGYFPLMTDITYNGIFSEYYFDTGNDNAEENTEDMFYPSYSVAKSKDPISGEDEYYMSVGLNSNIKESDFQRKKLNLVLVLDISGSMDSYFDEYYYDYSFEENEKDAKTKMKIAQESINMLIDRLNPDDSLGIVLFESGSHVAKELNLNSNVDLDAIKDHILEVEATGGTNFEAGYEDATELFEDYELVNNEEYENRIIVLTDAMPNIGETSDEGLLGMVKDNAENGIYTTFLGIGVDFNTELIEEIGDVRGANYYAVNNEDEFNSKMDEEFEYMVTPLVFDLKLNLESEGYTIEKVYGSDTENYGELMNVNTLFPSKSVDGETKGGIVLLKLKKESDSEDPLKLTVEYTDRAGEKHSNEQVVEFKNSDEEFYDNTGIRKGIVLTRYVNVIRDWIAYERTEDDKFMILYTTGINEFDEEYYYSLGEQERQSVELTVSDEYKKIFADLKSYIENENKELKDETLEKEIEILDKLIEL